MRTPIVEARAWIAVAAAVLIGCGGSPRDGAGPEDGARSAAPGGRGGSAPAGGGAGADAGAGAAASGGGATGASGGAVDGGGAAADCASLAVCEDFETATAFGDAPDAKGWHVAHPNCAGTGAIAVTDQVARSGKRSLRVDGAAGYCNHVFLANEKATGGAGPLFLRFYVRIDRPLGDDHVTLLAMKDRTSGKDLRFGGQKQVVIWNRESDDATLPELSPAGVAKSVAPAALAWHCVEIAIDGPAITTRIDGASIAGLRAATPPTPDVDQTWQRSGAYAPAPADVRVGWESYGNGAATLWLDDIAASTAPIGCGA